MTAPFCRLVIAQAVHPAYYESDLLHGRNTVRYLTALVLLALVTSGPAAGGLECPPPGHVRELAGLSRRAAGRTRERLRAAGVLTRTKAGPGTVTTLHPPGYLWGYDGPPLLSGLRNHVRATHEHSLLPVMHCVLESTPYGLSSVSVSLAQLAREAGYSVKWTRHTLDKLAALGLLQWAAKSGGLATITLSIDPAGLALLALPSEVQWASKP